MCQQKPQTEKTRHNCWFWKEPNSIGQVKTALEIKREEKNIQNIDWEMNKKSLNHKFKKIIGLSKFWST